MYRRKGFGNGENGEFTFLDTLDIISFILGTMNLKENLNQRDKQELLETFSKKTDDLLNGIHKHLQQQDKKIDYIIGVLSNDSRRNF